MSATICRHLQPLAQALAAANIELVPIDSPYGEGSTWWRCGCTFKAQALRKRLGLEACVVYVEYDGHAAGADATWTCEEHQVVFMGPHPAWASADTPLLK